MKKELGIKNSWAHKELFSNVDGFAADGVTPRPTGPTPPAPAMNEEPSHMKAASIGSGIGSLAGIGFGVSRYMAANKKAAGTGSVLGIFGWWILGAIAGGIMGRVVSGIFNITKEQIKGANDGHHNFAGKKKISHSVAKQKEYTWHNLPSGKCPAGTAYVGQADGGGYFCVTSAA